MSTITTEVNLGALVCSTGTITEVFPEAQASRINLPYGFPCAVSDAHVEGGMSGGPVFSANGTLLGVWSSSSPGVPPNDSESATFALIWPILGASMSGSPDRSRWTVERSVYRAAEIGAVKVRNLSSFAPVVDREGRINGFRQDFTKRALDNPEE
jgi:hypothetical protein